MPFQTRCDFCGVYEDCRISEFHGIKYPSVPKGWLNIYAPGVLPKTWCADCLVTGKASEDIGKALAGNMKEVSEKLSTPERSQ